MKIRYYFVFLLIFITAAFLRIWQLDKVPVELFGDEIDVGLQAYSILKTGKDYLGNSFPLMFSSFEEYRLPVFIYSSVPFIAFFGLNEWGVRMTSVFWGLFGITGAFLLTKRLFDKRSALFASFFLAISPWHLQYSRQGGIESVALLTMLTFAIGTFLKGLENFRWLPVSAALFALSVYTYATAAVFVPIFGFFLVILYRKPLLSFGALKLVIVAIVGFAIMLPYINLNLQGKAGVRFSNISIWSDNSLVKDINERRQQEGHSFLSTIFHNKAYVYFYEATGSYLQAISPEFLFFKGDPNLRHSVGGMGELYLFEFLTMITGLIFLKNNRHKLLILGLLLIAPIPSALTRDGGYHASRLMIMLLAIPLLSAYGLSELIRMRKIGFMVVLIIISVLSVINIGSYLHRYYNDWPRDSFRFWQEGYKESMEYIKRIDKDYKRIYLNNTYETTLPRFLFWYKLDPSEFQKKYKGKDIQEDIIPGFDGFVFNDKYYFGTINRGNITSFVKQDELYLVSFRDETGEQDLRFASEKPKILKTVIDPFNKPIFYIVTKQQP